MVETSDAHSAAVDALLSGVLTGEPVELLEGDLVDCKEDPSRRGTAGARVAGQTRPDELAKTVADAIACFANAAGGSVVVGVDDKGRGADAFVGTSADAAWLTNRIRQLVELEVHVIERDVAGARLLVVTVEPSAVPIADTSHRYRRRQGRDCQEMRPVELGSFSINRRATDWSAVLTAATVSNADRAALDQLRAWLRQSGEPSRVELATTDDHRVLHKLGVATTEGQLNRAGELLCVRLPGRAPLLDLTCRPAAGADTDLRLDEPEAPLAVALAAVEAAIALRNPLYLVQRGLARGQVRALPELALREALVNAIAHRDWSAPGPVRAQLEGTQLAVTSPGGFLPGVTAETVITAPPRTRNAQLARALRGLRLAEDEGIGVDRMFRETVRQGLATPEITELPAGSGVRCVLLGGPPDPGVSAVVASLGSPADQDVDVLLILYVLQQRATVNATALAPVIQKSRTEAAAALERAHDAGLVVEATRKGHVRLVDSAREALRSRLLYLRRSEADYAVVIADLLADHGEVRARDLIDACGSSQTQASRALAQATSNGLLARHGDAGAHVFYTAR